MFDTLHESNLDLLSEIDKLIIVLNQVTDVPELAAYQDYILTTCTQLRQEVQENLQDLALRDEDLYPDILSRTQYLTRDLHLYNDRLAAPILRFRDSDKLSLRVIAWLHNVHPQTRGIPAAISTQEFAIWPTKRYPTIYFVPASAQYGLLYLSLLFHEIGHLLYVCHEPELKELVKELQEQIALFLQPLTRRNDPHAQAHLERGVEITLTWYAWAQEIFCDAVGVTIGGPAFIHTFNRYLRMNSRKEYHRQIEDLRFSTHPVTWLRVQLLKRRAAQLGYKSVANNTDRQWAKIAKALGVTEDYYGFFESDYLPTIWQTLDDMLTEVDPYTYKSDEFKKEVNVPTTNPVHLINFAWKKFLESPQGFPTWEQQAINHFVSVPFVNFNDSRGKQ